MSKNLNRKIYIDFIRCVAIFMVIFNHSSSAGYMLFAKYPVGTLSHSFYLMNSIFIKIGVPLFFMISGALLLKRDETLRQVLKRFFRYLCVLIVSSAITYIWSGKVGGYYEEISLSEFWKIFYTNRHATAYWYLYTYLMYILMLPILRKIAKNMGKQEWIYMLCIYIVLNSLVFLDFIIWKGELTHNSYMTCFIMLDYVIYPLFGYYVDNVIKIDSVKIKHIIILCSISFGIILINAAMTDYRCQIIGSWSEAYCQLFYERYILVVAISFMLAIKFIFVKIKTDSVYGKIVASCGSLTFGIYLLERIWRHETSAIYRVVENYVPPIIACWVWILAACMLGGLCTAVIKKIPVVKDYI